LVNSGAVRRGISAVLIAAFAYSLTATFAAQPPVPACCIKAHGCSMQKRAPRPCAFASCDQSETGTAAMKQSPAILTDQPIDTEHSSSTFEAALFFLTLPLSATTIDHPPRLLPA
jgi:hypothetical protein